MSKAVGVERFQHSFDSEHAHLALDAIFVKRVVQAQGDTTEGYKGGSRSMRRRIRGIVQSEHPDWKWRKVCTYAAKLIAALVAITAVIVSLG